MLKYYFSDCSGEKEGVLFFRHLSLQYLTSSQQFCHFLRQLKGRLHTSQVFCGKSVFLRIFIELKQSAFLIVCLLWVTLVIQT